MKFKLQWKDVGGTRAFWETHEEDTTDPQKWSEGIIEWYNSTLRPHETARELLAVEILDQISIKDHKWSKQNITTLTSPQGLYDSVKCERCGVVARRYGLTRIVRQTPYRAKKFERCDSAMKALS